MIMNHQEKKADQTLELRQRTEDALRGKPVVLDGLCNDDIQSLLHELQVQQAELSTQNKELRRDQLDLEISRNLYFDLYNFAPSGYCTLSEKGRILNANHTLAELLGVDREKLLNRLLSDFVDSPYQDKYYLHCKRTYTDHRRTESEIQLVKIGGARLVVRILSVIDRGDPTRLMVMLDNITDQRRLEVQQKENAEQMGLRRRVIEQSEMERGELARNLHDGPIQDLVSMIFSIQTIKDILKEHGVDGDRNLDQLRDDVKNLISELRNICNNLRPPMLSRLGLRRAIKENVAEIQSKNPKTRINLYLGDNLNGLPDYITLALYRIYQQAMNNIERHAEASEVWVRLGIDLKQILFEIHDNGRGIAGSLDWDDFARQGHLGVIGMKERAEAIGGSLQIFSRSGEGTLVQVSIPVNVIALKKDNNE